MRSILSLAVCGLAALSWASPLDDEINAALKKEQAPGVSVMAVQNGKVLIEKGYGLANVEHRVPMTAQSVHELASVSKQFTAAAILLLAQEKKLSIDDKLSKHFPNQGADWEKVTILHLLHHTSGLPKYLVALRDLNREWTPNQMVESIGKKPLEFQPGSKWDYSNSGYMLLGVIVAKVSGQSLGDFLQKRFFSPLKMTNSHLNSTRSIVPHRADGYDLEDNRLIKEFFTSQSLASTVDGPVMSTVGDLWRWNKGLHHGQVLDAAHYKIMTTPSKASAQSDFVYGCGIGVFTRSNGEVIFGHGGGWTGTSTSMFYCPSRKDYMATLCNLGEADLTPIETIIRKHFNFKVFMPDEATAG